MQVDPASAFVLAKHGDSRLPQLIYQPNNEAEQDARAQPAGYGVMAIRHKNLDTNISPAGPNTGVASRSCDSDPAVHASALQFQPAGPCAPKSKRDKECPHHDRKKILRLAES
jgi:hypothetical protein